MADLHIVTITLTFATLIAVSSAYPLAALSALLGGNGLSSNLNNYDVGTLQQNPQYRPREDDDSIQPVRSSCPCSKPQTEIFVTETPRGSEIIAAETTNGNGISLATINDDYANSGPEPNQESETDRNSQLSSQPPLRPLPITDQPISVYPSNSYAGSVSGALSHSGHHGHSMSASGSLAGNLGYSTSMSGASSGFGNGNGLGHVGSMAGSMSGPHGSLAGSLAGSHGMHGGSSAGSLSGIHHGGVLSGSMAGGHGISGGSMAGSVASVNRNIGEISGEKITPKGENPPKGFADEEIKNVGRNDGRENDERMSEKITGDSQGSNSVGIIDKGVIGREDFKNGGATAGSVAGASNANGGSALSGSMASSTVNGRAKAGSIASAERTGSQDGSATSGSLAGSHNGISRAVSSAIAGYHNNDRDNQGEPLQEANIVPEEQNERTITAAALPDQINRRNNINKNKNVNRNVNYNANNYG